MASCEGILCLLGTADHLDRDCPGGLVGSRGFFPGLGFDHLAMQTIIRQPCSHPATHKIHTLFVGHDGSLQYVIGCVLDVGPQLGFQIGLYVSTVTFRHFAVQVIPFDLLGAFGYLTHYNCI